MSQNFDSSNPPSSGASHGGSPDSLRKNVRIALFALLGVLVIAIAYDYLYARPAVDKAYDKIAALNNDMNVSAGAKVLKSDDIHAALGRQPTTVLKEDPFTIEVYQWRAGLPWRTYDYYVVYVGQKELAFSTHFKNERMPMENLAPPVEWKEGIDVVPPPTEIGANPDNEGSGVGQNDAPSDVSPAHPEPADGDAPPQKEPETPAADTPATTP